MNCAPAICVVPNLDRKIVLFKVNYFRDHIY